MNKKMLIIFLGFLIVAATIGFVVINNEQTKTPTTPDPIPSQNHTAQSQPIQEGWKLYTDTVQGFSFQYPDPFPATYTNPQEWPPQISVSSTPLPTCTPTKDSRGTTTAQKSINGTQYCVTIATEGAAGSTYTTYTYATMIADRAISAHFVLRSVQCVNYDDPNKTECEQENKMFNVDTLIDTLIHTIEFTQATT